MIPVTREVKKKKKAQQWDSVAEGDQRGRLAGTVMEGQ